MKYVIVHPEYLGNRNAVYAFPAEFESRIGEAKWSICGELELKEGTKLKFISAEQGGHNRFEKGLEVRLIPESFPRRAEEIEAIKKITEEAGFSLGTQTLSDYRAISLNIFDNPDKPGEVYGINSDGPIDLAPAQKNYPNLEKVIQSRPIGLLKNIPFKVLMWRINRLICGSMHERAETPPAIIFPTESRYNHFVFKLGQFDK